MKATLLLLAPAALLIASCSQNQGEVGTPVAPAANTGNEYGVPGTPGVPAPGTYVPEGAPYQPVDPINPPAVPAIPGPPVVTPSVAPAAPTDPSLNGNVYTIQAGDSLWGLSRKFGTSVEALKEANGLSSNTIIEGRTLIIPGR